jgi:hypothetical protein
MGALKARYPMILTTTVLPALHPVQVFINNETHGKYPVTDKKLWTGSVMGLVPLTIEQGFVAGHAGPMVV